MPLLVWQVSKIPQPVVSLVDPIYQQQQILLPSLIGRKGSPTHTPQKYMFKIIEKDFSKNLIPSIISPTE
jgi:hypothetical protein